MNDTKANTLWTGRAGKPFCAADKTELPLDVSDTNDVAGTHETRRDETKGDQIDSKLSITFVYSHAGDAMF